MPPDDAAETDRPVSLAAVLADHAARRPHRPFLFWPEGLDWRWLSFADAAREVARLNETAAATPDGDEGGDEVKENEHVPPPPPAVAEALRVIAGPPPAGDSPAFRQLAEIAASLRVHAARAFGAVLAMGAPPGQRHDVVVLAPPFADDPLFDWAVVAGAALVVEPSPANLAATAAWARPTVFRGTAADLAALARDAAAAERTGFAAWLRTLRRLLGQDAPPPLPFARLHTLLLPDPPPPEETLTYWRHRNTRLLPAPRQSE